MQAYPRPTVLPTDRHRGDRSRVSRRSSPFGFPGSTKRRCPAVRDRQGTGFASFRYLVKIAAVVVASVTEEPAAAPERVFSPAGSGTVTVDWLGLTTTYPPE
jgi:hypothetical protein